MTTLSMAVEAFQLAELAFGERMKKRGVLFDPSLSVEAGLIAALALLERPVVVGDSEVSLWDTQWMNIVNHDNCYREWSKDDAIAHAVKMTEKAISRNVSDGNLPPRKDTLESMVRGKS